jgi:prepilin-type processing-associated H-X9-DG protein
LLVIAIIALLAAALFPAIARAKAKAKRIVCVGNLRQVGLAFHSFAHDHGNRFPMDASNSGDFREPSTTSHLDFAARHFRPLAAELVTPKLLICATDTRRAAANFTTMRDENLSYFVALDAVFGRPNSLLAGDRNVAAFKPGLDARYRLDTSRPLSWTAELHQFSGNLLFGDGHVTSSANHGPALTTRNLAGFTDLAIPFGPGAMPDNRGLPHVLSLANQSPTAEPPRPKLEFAPASPADVRSVSFPWQLAVGYAIQTAVHSATNRPARASTLPNASEQTAGQGAMPQSNVDEPESESFTQPLMAMARTAAVALYGGLALLLLGLLAWLIWRRQRERAALRRIRRFEDLA